MSNTYKKIELIFWEIELSIQKLPKQLPIVSSKTLRTMVYSVVIPMVFANIRESRIRGVFEALNLGEIIRIDMVPKKASMAVTHGKKMNTVFVHFKRISPEVFEALKGEKSFVKVVYDEPWFWKIYRSDRPMPQRRAAPTLEIPVSNSGNLPEAPSTPPTSSTPLSPPGAPSRLSRKASKIESEEFGGAVNLRTDTLSMPVDADVADAYKAAHEEDELNAVEQAFEESAARGEGSGEGSGK